jgi:hypothetical protein
MYRGFLVDKGLMVKDPHFRMGCKFYHQGDGAAYATKQEVKDRPACVNCHNKLGQEKLLTMKIAHTTHRDKPTWIPGCRESISR